MSSTDSSLTAVSVDLVLEDPVTWRERLRRDGANLRNLTKAEIVEILRAFLDACLRTGPGSVPRREVRNILETIDYLLTTDKLDLDSVLALAEIFDGVLRRDDIDQTQEFVSRFRQLLVSGLGGSAVQSAEEDPISNSAGSVSLVPSELESLLGGDFGSDPVDLMAVSSMWLTSEVRQNGANDRHRVDLLLLRAALMSEKPLSLDFVHDLYLSDDFWLDEQVRSWCTNLGNPVSQRGLGTVAAAMLNSRIRDVVPRMFLKNPDALVIDAIARGDEIERIKELLQDEFATQIWLALQRVSEALKPERPHKRPLQEIRESFENTLTRYSMSLIGEVGEVVPYDPDVHLSSHPMFKGDEVVVVQGGLKSTRTGLVLHQIKVVPITERAEEKAEDS